MSRFRKSERREVPMLNTSSLSDLIFTLLFFFMISTSMKDNQVKVEMELPSATQMEDVKEEDNNLFIYIGKPKDTNEEWANDTFIQVNDSWIPANNLPGYIQQKYTQNKLSEVIVILKADKYTPMGLIIDVKKMLQNQGIRKVQYSVNP